MKRLLGIVAFAVAPFMLAADYGPPVGSPMPAFEAPDQNGKVHTLKDILRPNGAALVFFRSADW